MMAVLFLILLIAQILLLLGFRFTAMTISIVTVVLALIMLCYHATDKLNLNL